MRPELQVCSTVLHAHARPFVDGCADIMPSYCLVLPAGLILEQPGGAQPADAVQSATQDLQRLMTVRIIGGGYLQKGCFIGIVPAP